MISEKDLKDEQEVWALLFDGSIVAHYWKGTRQQRAALWQGNIFLTREEAISERQKRVRKVITSVKQTRPKATGLYKASIVGVISEEVNGKEKIEKLCLDGITADFETILKVCEEWKAQNHG